MALVDESRDTGDCLHGFGLGEMELLARLRSLLGATPPLDEGVRNAIARGVDIADPLMRTVPRYEQKLATTAREALNYCFKLAADIPGPIDINGRVFSENPLVHAFFSGPEQIREMLGRSQAVRDFVVDASAPHAEEFFGLLGMRLHERKVMGTGLHGDRVRREVPQTLLYFSDHTLLELSAELAQTRQRIGELGFDSLAISFAGKVQQLRQERQEVHTQWEFARATRGDPEERAQALRELELRLSEANQRLMPEQVLKAYLAWMASPASILRLDPVTVTVDRLGVLVNPAEELASKGDTISFPELVARDRRRWILVLVRIRRDEVLQALESVLQPTRYLLI